MNIGWNKFRILVTNRCNYHCPFCHNEGQDKSIVQEQMTFDDFRSFVDIIANLHISEINFSGGEPLLNPEIVDMILYANNKLTGDISCATNLSLITTNMIEKLANTRLKFNIQFPYINESAFIKSTGNGFLSKIKSNIKAVKEAGIKIGLNTVIQSRKIEAIIEMIEFAIQNELPLKLLPQIGLEGSDKFKDQIYPILNRYATTICDKGTEVAIFCKLLAVAFYIFQQIFDNPATNYRIIRYNQNRDDGIDPSAKGQPFGFSEFSKSTYRTFSGHTSQSCLSNEH